MRCYMNRTLGRDFGPYRYHAWFAWRPVKAEGRWVWLRCVWRRLRHDPVGMTYWTYLNA
jgi:hypothetical protein